MLGFLEKDKETALGSTSCLGREMLRFGVKSSIHWRPEPGCIEDSGSNVK